MRPIPNIGKPGPGAPTERRLAWLEEMVDRILMGSQDDFETIADAFKVTNAPASPVRTLNVSTATAADLAKVLGALLNDLHKRGTNRGSG